MRTRELARGGFSEKLGVLSFGLFCAGVIAISIPLFWDSVIAQRSITTVNSLKAGEFVSTRQLEAALTAIGPLDTENPPIGDRLINQGILALTIALRLPDSEPQKSELLSAAIALTEARLERAPADTHSWARLALAEYLLNGPTDRVYGALGMSHETGPYEYYALKPRLQLGLTLWPLLDDRLREQTVIQAVMLWQVPRERVWLAEQCRDWAPDFHQRLHAALEARGQAQAFADRLTQFCD